VPAALKKCLLKPLEGPAEVLRVTVP
jgi:hypothetical protein